MAPCPESREHLRKCVPREGEVIGLGSPLQYRLSGERDSFPEDTRKDGSAFERLLLQVGTIQQVGVKEAAANDPIAPASAAANDEQGSNQEVDHG